MPVHQVYIEPFAGGGAVARLKRPAALNILSDLDSAALELARDAGMPRHGSSDSSRTGNGDVAGRIARLSDGVLEPEPPRWISFLADGLDFLENNRFDGSELVYCDPPYMRETRKSAKDIYRFEWDTHHHARLLAWLAATPARVILSGYSCDLYNEALAGWGHESFMVMTRRGQAREELWYNFTRPTVLHDDRFLGDGFRERERIKRKQFRWVQKLKAMEPAERAALRAAMSLVPES